MLSACGGATDQIAQRHDGKDDTPTLSANKVLPTQEPAATNAQGMPTADGSVAAQDSVLARPFDLSVDPRSRGVEDVDIELCDQAFLGREYVLEQDDSLPEFFVDVNVNQTGDGSPDAPFATIAEALRDGRGSRIYVAKGEYAEELRIENGVRLFGGYDAENWRASATEKSELRADLLTFLSGSAISEVDWPSELDGFDVEASIQVTAGARVVLRNNVLAPKLHPQEGYYGDSQAGTAVRVESAALRAEFNELHVPSDDPIHVVSAAFSLNNSCARLVDNLLTDFRIPFGLTDSDNVVIGFNVVARGNNGFFLASSSATIVGNILELVTPSGGGVYGVYIHQGSLPRLRGNDFSLESLSNGWFNEASLDADPVELVDNSVYLGQRGTTLYIDERSVDDPLPLTRLFTMDQVNALTDVELLGGNISVFADE